ncbi:golgin subfamily A member 4 isoform X3 [Frankliniella occidentalis]|uniref:Golgin subfamily A member 4 isoform X3 n=1 Tax=Frankliniella occidentalis TaxID=133901 RepID=A0A6J1SYN6_FRAOC|nr:golgin subfamily A member 4 isoform X3 [Frankliniella occidentalis]
MFKKLKDKLTEEVKIPSQKFTQSMQQLAQAVVSPGSSNNSTIDTASNDNFSIDGDFDDTPQGSPIKKAPSQGGVAYRGGQATPIRNSFDAGSSAGFMHVDLQPDTSTPKMPSSLRSSVSSLASDSSFMFPVLESSGATYNFQSDLESCSEASESVGPNINKEQILSAYQKIQQKYHKYKGRYADLAKHYRDLERDNKNAKHILTECQDKALRRMAELKEQCNLEKQAKAHLEEALRSDLEEKDHLIHTLETKYCNAELQIKLLRAQGDQVQTEGQSDDKIENSSAETLSDSAQKVDGQEDLLTGGDTGLVTSTAAAVLTPEPASAESENALKEKLKKLESLLHKCKEDITNKRESIKQLESDKQTANAKIDALQQQLITIQKREEEASLSLAKNKQTIHQELESKEEEIKKLSAQLALNNAKISELQNEILQVKDDSKKEIAASKQEVTKLMKAELSELLAQKKAIEDNLSLKEVECKSNEIKLSELVKRLEQQDAELDPLKKTNVDLEAKYHEETGLLQGKISELETQLKAMSQMGSRVDKLKPILAAAQELRGLHKQLQNDTRETQSHHMKLIGEQAQMIQEKFGSIVFDLTEENKRVLSELDEYKRESMNARESLAAVSNKFALLEQTLSTEKSGVEARIVELDRELKQSEQQISVLEKTLESERVSHTQLEEEMSRKLTDVQTELEDLRKKSMETHEDSTSAEMKLQCDIHELEKKLKDSEEKNLEIVNEYGNLKSKTSILEVSTEQLRNELEILKTRERESINEMTSMQMLLNEKSDLIEKLESVSSELEDSLISIQEEKREQELKWNTMEVDLGRQIADLRKEHEETEKQLEKFQEKETAKSDDFDRKLLLLEKEHNDKLKEISDIQNILKERDSELEKSIARNTEVQNDLEKLKIKCQEQESSMLALEEENRSLMETIQKLETNDEKMSVHLKEFEKSSIELEKTVLENSNMSAQILKLEENLQIKTTDLNKLQESLLAANVSYSKLEEKLQSKTDECSSLMQEVQKLNTTVSEQTIMLQEKSEGYNKMTVEMGILVADKSQVYSGLQEKIKECESLSLKLSNLEKYQTEGSEELASKNAECKKLEETVNRLKSDKIELNKTLETKCQELETVNSQLTSLREELSEQSNLLHETMRKCDELALNLNNLTIENEKTVQLLKQKTLECEDKENQLDNLADEMKRVEELSQELHCINDDRDANVEVLSTEASSLAQKVEELTQTTQDLKEREVSLLAKLQVAQDLEAEYISMKQREEMFLSKLNEVKMLELALKANEEDLLTKTKEIEELEEENKKLKDAGSNLNEIVARCKEAEAKCVKLQDDGADLLLRIQRAEESEIKCSLLEEELKAIKREKAELSQEVEVLQAKTVFRGNTSENSPVVAQEPVVEEPCVIKRYADLTENHQGQGNDKWQEKYNKLLKEHQKALQENAATIERLKEENLLDGLGNSSKRKERLWDQQEASLPDGNSNGSFGVVEKLQQQLAAVTTQLKENKKVHRQEMDDLRRILLNHGSSNSHTSSRSDNLEDATELEYLRNILYEYMMGKEPMILARVIAAVVKFDSDQTSKVLQKEQQRLSLLGHLGIS